jgi:sec-independent protein translocase protein TatC
MLKTYEDDLFRESTMTFGEHLEELKHRLVRAVFWLVLGLLVGLVIGKPVVHLIESPLTKALEEYYANKAKETLKAKYGSLPPEAEALFLAGYVADQVNIEPARALEDIARAAGAGDGLANLKLPAYRLLATDIHDPRSLAESLKNASAAEDHTTAAYRIWERLQPKERQLVESIAAGQEETVPPDRISQLADALNRLLSDAELYSQTAFPLSSLDAETAKLVERRANLSPSERQRLNWWLLTVAVPSTIAGPHPYLAPLTIWRPGNEDERLRPKAMGAAEAFVIYMKAAFLSGLIIFSPMIFRELWLFVAAGLYPHERRYVHIFLPFSVGLFICGALLAFFAAFPPVLHFLFGFNDWLGIPTELRISEWLSFVLFLPLAFGIGFQMPLVMLFINRIGVVSVEQYWRGWRVAVLVIFVLAPILNPSPDPYSMLLMAVPMTLLYFGGILLCQYASRRKPKGIGGE